ncbi:hypothetical protein [uncultured Tyzzerella sp.]|uniref:hypothetical protein n=1 Tax=uncultured Tyzzerella sp. TaxID=2321398 RepID=UPI0029431F4A|nr:hypothetical protein [uncultured Tyzzerella sp.]
MDNNFCVGCPGIQQPLCAVKDIYNGITLNEVISKAKKSASKYLVCHKNAIKIENGAMVITEKCDSCGLCKISCSNQLEKEYDKKIEKPIFAELGKLNIFLSNIFSDALVATEVKTEGNFRQKRIDAVIGKENSVILIKVLANVDKYNFYHRSYEEVMKEYKNKYPELGINIVFIVPESKIKKARQLEYDVICIDEIKSIV